MLPKLTSTKAQITIAERKEQEYLQYQRQNNLFFDEQTDEQLIKFRKKLSKKRQQYKELITKIYKETERHKGIYIIGKNALPPLRKADFEKNRLTLQKMKNL